MCPFHGVNTFSDDAEATVSRPADVLTRAKEVTARCPKPPQSLPPSTHSEAESQPVSFSQGCPQWNGKKSQFFLHLHSRVHLFNILCDEMGSTHNTFPLHTKVQRMSRRKLNSYQCMNCERKPLWHWISGTHFLENEMSLSLQGK